MNKYTELSDFEINKKVAARYYQNKDFIEAYKDIEKVFVDGNLFDPCNNPADAMPIIIENGIDLLNGENMMPELFGHHSTYTLHNFNTPIAADSLKEDKTIYRLGMEAFLMKKDAENES
ncbi:phage protein NinX family protein [Providencia sp.]|uniref:phage protein NinX family protein n=1 Tax=Providencia sp. TaxID=589 RepID=UPI003F9B1C22